MIWTAAPALPLLALVATLLCQRPCLASAPIASCGGVTADEDETCLVQISVEKLARSEDLTADAEVLSTDADAPDGLLESNPLLQSMLAALRPSQESADGKEGGGNIPMHIPAGIMEALSLPNAGDGHAVLHTSQEIAFRLYGVLIFIAIMSLIGLGFDMYLCPTWRAQKGRFPFWLAGFFLGNYLILIPSIISTIIVVTLAVREPESNQLQPMINDRFTGRQGDLMESIWSIISMLFNSGSTMAGVLVSIYGLGVPVVKAMLLILGEFWRDAEDDPVCARMSKKCVLGVQFISKWDSPKLICYILMICLVDRLDNPPLIKSHASLDIGFAYYAVFCVLTLVGSLAIPVPVVPEEPMERLPPLAVRCFGQRGVVHAVTALSVFAAGLLYVGCSVHLATIHFDPVSPLALVPKLVWDQPTRDNVGALGIAAWATYGMSIRDGITAIAARCTNGEGSGANNMIAVTLMVVFVIGFTLLDMCILIYAAWQLRREAASQEPGEAIALQKGLALTEAAAVPAKASEKLFTKERAMVLAHWVKYLSMLDVCIMGCVVMGVSTATSYQHCGVFVNLREGVAWLFFAEVFHYFVYYLVESSVDHANREARHAAEADSPLGPPAVVDQEPDPEPQWKSEEPRGPMSAGEAGEQPSSLLDGATTRDDSEEARASAASSAAPILAQ